METKTVNNVKQTSQPWDPHILIYRWWKQSYRWWKHKNQIAPYHHKGQKSKKQIAEVYNWNKIKDVEAKV